MHSSLEESKSKTTFSVFGFLSIIFGILGMVTPWMIYEIETQGIVTVYLWNSVSFYGQLSEHSYVGLLLFMLGIIFILWSSISKEENSLRDNQKKIIVHTIGLIVLIIGIMFWYGNAGPRHISDLRYDFGGTYHNLMLQYRFGLSSAYISASIGLLNVLYYIYYQDILYITITTKIVTKIKFRHSILGLISAFFGLIALFTSWATGFYDLDGIGSGNFRNFIFTPDHFRIIFCVIFFSPAFFPPVIPLF